MDKFERAKKLLEVANENRPTTKEVADFAVQIIKVVKDVQKTLKSDMESGMKGCEKMCNDVENSLGSLESKLTALVSKSSKETQDKAYKDLNNEVYKLEKLISDIPQFDSGVLESKWSTVISDLDSKIGQWKQLNSIEIRDLLERITNEEEKLDLSAIKGGLDLKKEVERIKKAGGKGVVSVAGNVNGVDIYVDGVFKATSRYLNFIAGSGMVITQASVGERTDITFTAGGSALAEITVSGTIDDSNVTFTAPSEPTYLIINGAMYKKTGGAITWSYSVGNITLSTPVGQGGSIYGLA